ncbi:MAG: aminotransferase class V-fold PLP-dependent enzyme [Actinomycetota bacterium]|nr:aminotransferase class V-fold PLP-dependent enzyme [Actinomycetota bacterium]
MGAYLDAASGRPLHPVARDALLAALEEGWADPGRLHGPARRTAMLLDAARESIAESIGARADEVSFAANGTQALHIALLGTLRGNRRAGPTLVHSAVEHSAVLAVAQAHADSGGDAVCIGVDQLGRVLARDFVEAARRPGTAAAALQAANHEVGTTQPIEEVVAEIGPTPLVVDATQTLGHLAPPSSWSVLVGDARAWGGPNVGIVAVRTGQRWRPSWPVDEREAGRVPGVPDVPSIVAAAASLRAVQAQADEQAQRLHDVIDRIRAAVPAAIADVEVLGDPVGRLPHIVTFSFLYVDGEALVGALDRRGFAVSSGSSCTSSTLEPSHVLVAMGALTSGNIRISIQQQTTDQEISEFLAVLPSAVAAVRAELGASGL